MEDCIFCDIATGKKSAYKVYEDATFMAFLDIFPRVKGHILLIPKKHYRWVYDVPAFGDYWEVARKVAIAAQKSLNAHYTSFVTVGLEVEHAHIHILPQQGKDTQGIRFTDVISLDTKELQHISDRIRIYIES